jgi:alkenylglycerophosphocholine hydrolase
VALPLSVVVALFLATATAAVIGSLTKRRTVVAATKPLTTALLFVVVGWPRTSFAWWIDVGILFSLAGDVALMGSARRIFLVGLILFLVAHVAYIVGFIGVASLASAGVGLPAGRMATAAVGVGMATALLLRRLLPKAGDLKLPVAVYALVISAMVVAAMAASRAPGAVAGLSPLAFLGAVLFYVSDASLALDTFYRPFRLAPILTLGVYWLGQLGIALSARIANG